MKVKGRKPRLVDDRAGRVNFDAKGIDLASDESIVLVVRQHWVMFRDPVVIMCFFPFVLLVVPFWAEELFKLSGLLLNIIGQVSIYTALGLFITGSFMFIWRFYLWKSSFYLVTNKRLFAITQLGLFSDDNRQTSLSNIQDVSAQVNGLQALLYGYGNVIVQLWTNDVPLILAKVPHPKEVQQGIMRQSLGASGGVRFANEAELHID